MKKLYLLFFISLNSSILLSQTNVGISGNVDGVYINEIHYDNTSTDSGEFWEIAGPAGTDLSAYAVSLYNGNGGGVYRLDVLPITLSDEGTGYGTYHLEVSGIQNGSPDGIALSKTGSTDVQFLSYEGTFDATDGPAAGLTSVDIGVSEGSSTPEGYSLEYDESTTSWYVSTDDTPGVFAPGVLSTKKNQLEGFSIYPNPTFLGYVHLTNNNKAKVQASVFNLLGKQVLSETIINNTLDVSNLKSGIYVIKVAQGGATSTQKLVIK